MRNLYYALITLVGFALFSCGPTYVVQNPNPAPPPQAPPAPEATYQNFYDALSPYGEWINNPEYGYVWMPNAGPDFKPYATNGNWVYTEEGWAWNSDYAWGWAPFHYGRWFYEDGYGWMWMPGNEWAPAWVTWRRSPDYYGWAPLGPSVSITVAVNGGYNPPPHYWCFVPHQYVASQHINNYYVNEQQNTTIINNTTVIHNTTIVNNTYNNTTVVNNNRNNTRVNNYAGGPDAGEVARVTGASLRPVAVVESNMPGANRTEGSFAIYRPRINATPQANNGNNGNGVSAFHPAPAPTRLQNLNNVRPVNTTTYSNNRGSGNNTTVNNATINNNTTNTNITNNNNSNNNTYNNFRPNPNPANTGQPGGQTPWQPNRQPTNQPINQGQPAGQPGNQGQPAGQPGNPNEFHPNNTRFVPGAGTNNGNPAVTPSTTPTPVVTGGNPTQVTGNRVPATGTDNGNGNGYRNNGNGNGNNGNGNNGNGRGNGNGNNGNNNGRGNGGNVSGNGNVHPGQPGTTGNPPKPRFQQGPKPKDTSRLSNPNRRP